MENLHGILLDSDAMGVYLGEDPRLGTGQFPMSQNENLKICAIKAIILTVLDDIQLFPERFDATPTSKVAQKKNNQNLISILFLLSPFRDAEIGALYYIGTKIESEKSYDGSYHAKCVLSTAVILGISDTP